MEPFRKFLQGKGFALVLAACLLAAAAAGVWAVRIVRDELDSFVELVKLPEKLSPLSKESVLEWFYMHRAYRDDRYDGMGCSGQFFTTRVRLFRRRGCWYAYHFVSVDM